jgi:hypothetical protein
MRLTHEIERVNETHNQQTPCQLRNQEPGVDTNLFRSIPNDAISIDFVSGRRERLEDIRRLVFLSKEGKRFPRSEREFHWTQGLLWHFLS